MTTYDFRYLLDKAPEARPDGSGCVAYDTTKQSKPTGTEDEWVVIPGRHRTVNIPFAQVDAALAAGTNPQIIAAYKAAFDANLDTMPIAIEGWDEDSLQALMEANDATLASAVAVDTFITVDLGKTYPVGFSL